MASAESPIWGLVQDIEPTASQKEGASRSHTHLAELLSQGPFGQRILDHYLSGSYARATAIRPIDDVDIIFVVDPSAWRTAAQTLYGGVPAPSTILDSFANAIRYRYPVSSVFGQRRSVRLQLYHLDIDVVPAIRIDAQRVWVPDVDSGNWIESAPKRHIEIATHINQLRNGNFKPLVKVLKYWNSKLPSTTTFKSFQVETIASWLFYWEGIVSLEDALHRFFDFICFCAGDWNCKYQWPSNRGVELKWTGIKIPDIGGTTTNIGAGIGEDRRKKFVQAATRSREKMGEAKAAYYVDTAVDRVREALNA